MHQLNISCIIVCFILGLSGWACIQAILDDNFTVCDESVCHGADLSSLYTIIGKVPASYLSDKYLFDSDRVYDCLQNKTITFLGDSTHSEVVHDIVMLMGGFGKDYKDYIQVATRQSKSNVTQVTYHYKGHPLIMTFYETHRHMLIEYPARNIKIYNRFIGHKQILANFGGVQAISDSDFQSTLHCLFGLAREAPHNTCKPPFTADCNNHQEHTLKCYVNDPDILIVQSGHHDIRVDTTRLEHYYDHVIKLMRQARNQQGIETYWKSNVLMKDEYPYEQLQQFDQIVRKYLKLHNIRLIDLVEETEKLSEFFTISDYSAYYPHIGAIAAYGNINFPMELSTLLTQRVLRDIC